MVPGDVSYVLYSWAFITGTTPLLSLTTLCDPVFEPIGRVYEVVNSSLISALVLFLVRTWIQNK